MVTVKILTTKNNEVTATFKKKDLEAAIILAAKSDEGPKEKSYLGELLK